MEWLAAALAALEIAKQAYAIGKDALPIVLKAIAILQKRETATVEELNELRSMSDALSDEIQKPIEPEQP